MRQKRAKAYRKLMHLYGQFFKFRQPYQLLIDPETCKMAIANKFDLVKQLSTVVQGEVKPMITQCCIHALYLAGKDVQEATDLAKTFERRKCNHREAIDPDDCLKDVVGESNKHRYVIVTQSTALRNILRKIAATPLIHINRSVMVLEPPSQATLRAKFLAEEKSLGAGASGSDIPLVQATTEEPKKKKKGPKGPNPLSVKKKKAGPTPPSKPKPASPTKKLAGGDASKPADVGKRKREEAPSAEQQPNEGDEGNKPRKRRRKGKTAETGSTLTAPTTE